MDETSAAGTPSCNAPLHGGCGHGLLSVLSPSVRSRWLVVSPPCVVVLLTVVPFQLCQVPARILPSRLLIDHGVAHNGVQRGSGSRLWCHVRLLRAPPFHSCEGEEQLLGDPWHTGRRRMGKWEWVEKEPGSVNLNSITTGLAALFRHSKKTQEFLYKEVR